MDELIFKEIILNQDPSVDHAIYHLITTEMHFDKSFESFQKNIHYSSGTTCIMGGFINNKIICINVFIRTNFKYKGKILFGYQSGFSATSSAHRGKGIWTKLMKFSEVFLTEKGASFIFGFPNDISYPLFTKKLFYTPINMKKFILVRLPFFERLFLKSTINHLMDFNNKNKLTADFDMTFSWKKNEVLDSKDIQMFQVNNSRVWGKIRSIKKMKIQIRFFEIGGLELDSNDDLKQILKNIFTQTKVFFIHFAMNEHNDHIKLLNFPKDAKTTAIIKPLGEFQVDLKDLNFFSGMADTF